MKANTRILVDELTRNFSEPFLPKGFFNAEPNGKGLRLQVGDRTLILNGKGRLETSGSRIGKGKLWDIKRIG